MKLKLEKHKQRLSLMLIVSGFALVFLIFTTVIGGAIVFFLIYRGTLQPGDNTLNPVSLFFYLILSF